MSKQEDGIRPSKVFTNGSIHETASGKFKVLDRYLADDGKETMLKVQWLNDLRIDENKEVNLRVATWKFKKAKGEIESVEDKPAEPEITVQDIYALIQTVDTKVEEISSLRDEVRELKGIVHKQNEKINEILEKMVFKLLG